MKTSITFAFVVINIHLVAFVSIVMYVITKRAYQKQTKPWFYENVFLSEQKKIETRVEILILTF